MEVAPEPVEDEPVTSAAENTSEKGDVVEVSSSAKEDEEVACKESKKKEPTTISVFGELLVIALALGSMAATSSSYSLLGKSATYVEPVLQNWQTKPVGYMVFTHPNQSCPDGTSSNLTSMSWPGANSLGCACPSTSGFSSARGESCDNSRLSAGCTNAAALAPLNMSIWRGTRICLNRTGQAVATFSGSQNSLRPTPDAEIPHQCADGYRRCGRTSLDAWRSTCTPTNDVCPLTFAGSEKIIGAYGAAVSTFASHSFSRNTQPFYNQTSDNETLYVAESSLVVMQQLPLVEFMPSFMEEGSIAGGYEIYGPCLNYVPDYRDNTQANYAGLSSYSTSGDPSKIRNSYPTSCERVDLRWIAYDHQTETSLLFDNILNHEYCAGLDYSQAQATNYWYAGAQCSTSSSSDISRQCAHEGYDDKAALAFCDVDDRLCRDEYYQSKCGKLMQMATAIAAQNEEDGRSVRIGLFRRSEIYWKEKCTADYKSVKENNKPLQNALTAQMALLASNIVLNIVTISISVIVLFVYEFNVDIPCIDGSAKEDALFLKVLNRRISLVAKIMKLAPIVTAIVYLSYVVDFYAEIASSECSDDVTNEAFALLGGTLPSTQQGNYSTLGMDVLQIFLPFLLYLRVLRKKDELKSQQMQEGTHEEHARHQNKSQQKSVWDKLTEQDEDSSDEEGEKKMKAGGIFDSDDDSDDQNDGENKDDEDRANDGGDDDDNVSIRKHTRSRHARKTLEIRGKPAGDVESSEGMNSDIDARTQAAAPLRSIASRLMAAFRSFMAPAGHHKAAKKAKPWQQV